MRRSVFCVFFFFFFQAEDGIRDYKVTGVQTCALPILTRTGRSHAANAAAAMARGSFMRARRCDSLNVNGIAPTPPHTKGPPASTRGRFAGGPADLASSGSP